MKLEISIEKDRRLIAEYFFRLRKDLKKEKELISYENIKKKLINKSFFRLEKNGLGPWYSFREEDSDQEHWIDGLTGRLGLDRDSSFVSDVWKVSKKEFIHACYSFENLKDWFSENEWDILQNEGYEVKEYYLNIDFQDIFFADNQVLLVKNDMRSEILDKVYSNVEEESKYYDLILDTIFEN